MFNKNIWIAYGFLMCAVSSNLNAMQKDTPLPLSKVKHTLYGRMALVPVSPAMIRQIATTRTTEHVCDGTCCHPEVLLQRLAQEQAEKQKFSHENCYE
jgi:hypothetical protein